ncbi:hypothetical protein LXL04_014276 [Taraxacum kok-saghyz]
MDEGGPSDDYDLDPSYRGPNYDSDFEISEFEGDESDESSDSGFVVDPDLDDSDVEASSSQPKTLYGKQFVDESEGLHDVAVVLTYHGHAVAQDLIQSHYTEAEVLMALIENPIEVEQITPSPEQEDVAVIAETQEDMDLVAGTQEQVQREIEEEAGIEETQHQVQNEELPAGIGEPQHQLQIEELAADIGVPQDQVQNEELPARRTRKKSQRIVRIKLGKKIGDPGATSDAPYSVD